MGLKILVTGSDGFVGTALCRRLKSLKHQVTALARKDQDITKPFTLKDDFDFVFHLAAHNITHVGNDAPGLYHAVNVEGTRHVIKAAKTKHFVFLSTAKVYLAQGKPITEDSPLVTQGTMPLKEYEKSKLAAEQLCGELLPEKSLLIFRSVNIVGPGQPEKAVIPVLFKKARLNEPLEIFGPRESVLQFLYVNDVVDAFVKVIEKGNIYGVFNLASVEKIRLDELAVAIKNICRSASEIRYLSEEKTAFSEVLADKAKKALGWRAPTTVRQILEMYS